MAKLSEKAQENKTRYNIEYAKKNYKRVPLDLTIEYYEYIKGVAQSKGMTLNGFIKKAMEEKAENVAEEIPPEIWHNLMEWLKNHGHSDADILDCLKYLGKE